MAIEGSTTEGREKRIRLGMVGGGSGAFIGGVHRIAARMDGRFDLVAGALSSNPETAAASAQDLGLARSYSDYRVMAREEAARPDGIRAVSIVTPTCDNPSPNTIASSTGSDDSATFRSIGR